MGCSPVCTSANLIQDFGDEGLPAKTRIHRQDEQHVDQVKERSRLLERGRGTDGESGLAADGANSAEGFGDIVISLHMHGDRVRNLRKPLKKLIRLFQHQVNVQGKLSVP